LAVIATSGAGPIYPELYFGGCDDDTGQDNLHWPLKTMDGGSKEYRKATDFGIAPDHGTI
jgi:hypothetical protein